MFIRVWVGTEPDRPVYNCRTGTDQFTHLHGPKFDTEKEEIVKRNQYELVKKLGHTLSQNNNVNCTFMDPVISLSNKSSYFDYVQMISFIFFVSLFIFLLSECLSDGSQVSVGT